MNQPASEKSDTWKSILVLVLASVCGSGAGYMTTSMIPVSRQTSNEPEETVTVLTAKTDLQEGTQFTDGEKDNLLAETKFLKGQEPNHCVKEFAEIKGKYLKAPLSNGMVVFLSQVAEEPVYPSIPEGYQAMGIRVSVEKLSDPHKLLGKRVDLIWHPHEKNSGDTPVRLAQNVLVLSVDSVYPSVNFDFKFRVFTIVLNPKQVEEVSLAKDKGEITFLLRKPGDETIYDKKAVPGQQTID